MLRSLAVFAGMMLALGSLSCEAAPLEGPPPTETESTFADVPDWPRLPPGRSFGRVLGVAVAPDGRIWVSHTAEGEARNEEAIRGATLAVLDPATGELLAELGEGQFNLPHALAFDEEGRLWVTDADANRIVVIDTNGRELFRVGLE